MSSLKDHEKRVAKRKQVYKPILDNPFNISARCWPKVNDQDLISKIFERNILNKIKIYRELKDGSEPPLDYIIDFNKIVEYLRNKDDDAAIMVVCNKDSIPKLLLSQIPIMCQLSKHPIKLIQLPKGFLSKFNDIFDNGEHDGMMLLKSNDKVDPSFISQVNKNVQDLSISWLRSSKFIKPPVKFLSSTIPVYKK